MQIRAAVLREQPGRWHIEDLELSAPGHGEVLVEVVATGLCHSDDHMAKGDTPLPNLPVVAGHEGAGIVREVGPGVQGLEVGDHIVTSFVPACGKCKWCSMGMQNLCDYGALILEGTQLDGGFRLKDADGQNVAKAAMLGTFANWQVFDQTSCVKIDKDVPLEIACLIGCGVPTGFGSAVNAAEVKPGDVTMILGAGGIGMNAVQGAAYAGARRVIVVDPQPFKREMALKLGATDVFATIADADALAKSLTNGQGTDSTIVTVGVTTGEHVLEAYDTVRKAGTLVVTGQGSTSSTIDGINLFSISMLQKRIQGCLYGGWSPRVAIPKLIELYKDNKLHLGELATRQYKLEDINQAYEAMHAGENIRGVVVHEH
ncbi:NDMA-dependent alcohol dehydrogenase [Georgenia sp. Z1491]|uniref:NDMA-dependent alcohol dehydrogenase n=1 Tax=Georgenia sp. Z1491 TaxID=3416707 RepID=UPI003CF413EC